MAAPRKVVELAISDEEAAELARLARSRTEPASRVERARMLLAYRRVSRWTTRTATTAGRTHMKIDCKDFRVREGDNVHLEKWPTRVDPVYKSKDQYKSLLEEHVDKLSAMQRLHYASNRHAILLILQATDCFAARRNCAPLCFARRSVSALPERSICTILMANPRSSGECRKGTPNDRIQDRGWRLRRS